MESKFVPQEFYSAKITDGFKFSLLTYKFCLVWLILGLGNF